jgi:hypothetical protein
MVIKKNLSAKSTEEGSMKRQMVAIACGALFLTAGASFCEAKDFAVGLKASTLGVGVEGEYAPNQFLGVRLGVNYFTYDFDDDVRNINYDFDLNLRSISALLDWHPFPFLGEFRISGGLLYNRNELEAIGRPRTGDVFIIGDNVFAADQVGTLRGDIEFNEIAPYLGVGWDSSFGKDHALGFVFELGALFQGSPDVRLAADGPVSGDATFQRELERERQELQDDVDDFKVYPVVSLGVVYRF